MKHKFFEQKPFFAVLVCGPTGAGKTALAHAICDFNLWEYKFEIVNLDAFQFFKNMPIGTAQPQCDEILKYHYHGIGILHPTEQLDAATYAFMVKKWCEEIWKKGKIPLCVGGSGLYFRAFLHGLDNLPARNLELRSKLRVQAKDNGWPELHRLLATMDPRRAAQLHPNDSIRIERALEICILTGTPASEQYQQQKTLREQKIQFPCYVIQIESDIEYLKSKILLRLKNMLSLGWLQEVADILKCYGDDIQNSYAFRAIGYSAIAKFLIDNNLQKSNSDDIKIPDHIKETIAIQTWQYAKRQITWNKKERWDKKILASQIGCDVTIKDVTDDFYKKISQL